MNRIKFTFVVGILFATVFVFSCGDEISAEESATNSTDDKCGGSQLEPSQFCYAETVIGKCGGKAYNPLDSFCYASIEVRARCGGARYETTHFCNGDRIYEKCNGAPYDPLTSFCDTTGTTNVLSSYNYKKCGDSTYNVAVSFCGKDNKVYDLCDKLDYDIEKEFCYYYNDGREVLAKKCNGATYDPSESFCDENGDVTKICGTNGKYDSSVKFCYNNSLYSKCRGKEYDTEKLFCYNDSLYLQCGNNPYRPLVEFCRGGTIVNYKFCPENSTSTTYDDALAFCRNGEVYSKCNFAEFDPSADFCHENKLYAQCGGKGIKECIDGKYDSSADSVESGQIGCYNPFREGCFEGQLYPLCIAEGAIGVCVYETNLRCKQAGGSGISHIVSPLLGMKCVDPDYKDSSEYSGTDKGKIVGKIILPDIEYKTIQIGEQIWMAENLKRGTAEIFSWGEACSTCHNDKDSSMSYAKRQGLCPSGWHIPSSEDLDELINYAGGSAVAGNSLKSIDDDVWSGKGLDSYGFNAKPVEFEASIVDPISSLNGSAAPWWTSTSYQSSGGGNNGNMAKFWYVNSSDGELAALFYHKNLFKFSVRCLFDGRR